MKKKHLLFVLDYYLPHLGGSETVFEQIISRLLKKGYQITLLTSRFDRNLARFESQDGLDIVRVGRGRISFMWFALFAGIKILFGHRDISVIHASTYGGAIPARVLAFLFRKKIVLTVHEVFGALWYRYKNWWKARFYRVFERSIFWFNYDSYHCVSLYTQNALRLCYGVKDEKLHVIYNGVDYDFWDFTRVSAEEKKYFSQFYSQDKLVILYYGHAGISKGVDVLLDALPEIFMQRKDVVFVFNIVDSKRKQEMLHRLQTLILQYPERIVLYHGLHKEKLRALVASVDAVVAPSLSEGFGSVHTEAVALGKPLVTSFVASIPEVVGGVVYFVPPGDVQALIRVFVDMKKHQPQVVSAPSKRFSREQTVDALEKLY